MSDKKLDPEVAQFFERHWKTSPVALALAYHLFDDERAIAGNDKDSRAEVARLRAALLRYGHHDDGCASWEDGPRFCTCGFGAARGKE